MKRKRIRVLVVDDSPFVCKAISRMLQSDRHISVVGHAYNGKEALWKISVLNPDLVTLDIEMPVLDGLETLALIMQKFPRPVLMLSALTKSGAEVTLRALEMGAFDFVDKSKCSQMDIHSLREELIAKVKAGARVSEGLPAAAPLQYELIEKAIASSEVQVERLRPVKEYPPKEVEWGFDPEKAGSFEALLMGASTGGPVMLESLLATVPVNFPAGIVIVQHMPDGFTEHFAHRLGNVCRIAVREAKQGEVIKPGEALVAPSGRQLKFRREGEQVKVMLTPNHERALHVPSVNVMFGSAAEVFGSRQIAVLLTGMGRDGADGMLEVHEAGGLTLAQDEKSCVVAGMPKAAIKNGAVKAVLSPHKIVPYVCEAMGGERKNQENCLRALQ
jgi:two-component system chemotaxis response regulator CheB